MAGRVQELLDDLAAELGLPVSVDDRRWRLLGHSAHADEVDPVRRQSIMARMTRPEVVGYLEGLGLDRATGIVDVPPRDDLGMSARLCVPVRHGGVLMGFLWVVPPGTLDLARRARLDAAAGELGDALWHERVATDPDRAARREALHAVLRAYPYVGEEDAARLAELVGWGAATRWAVAVMASDEDAAERLRRRWDGELVWLESRDEIVVLARLGGAGSLADALAGPGGMSAAITRPHDVPRAAEEARIARRLGGDAVTAYDDLGASAAIASLLRGDRHRLPSLDVVVFEHRQGAQLLEAAEAFLDAAGDVAAAAAALGVHRATLYRRLARLEEILELSFASGDDRLLLHLALRVHRIRLAGA